MHHDDPRSAQRGGALARVDPVPLNCAVNLDSVESVSVERLGRLSHDRMDEVCAALEVAVDCGR